MFCLHLTYFFIIFSSLKGLLALAPVVFISSSIANYACSFVVGLVDWAAIVVKTVVWLIASSIILTSYLVYCSKEKILDALI